MEAFLLKLWFLLQLLLLLQLYLNTELFHSIKLFTKRKQKSDLPVGRIYKNYNKLCKIMVHNIRLMDKSWRELTTVGVPSGV